MSTDESARSVVLGVEAVLIHMQSYPCGLHVCRLKRCPTCKHSNIALSVELVSPVLVSLSEHLGDKEKLARRD